MRANIKHEQHEKYFEKMRRQIGRQYTPDQRAGDDAWRHLAPYFPIHCAMLMVRAKAGDGGKNNARQRSAEREVHNILFRKMMRNKNRDQHRHDNQAAAHTQQPGNETGKEAKRDISDPLEHIR